ncbi:hypothetical protein QTH47_13295 [Clostridium perfringens]|uniref:hypothetical protein n=1 Tax=Clostridium perfringens TaxID=1502 RepID=UPI0013E3620A|nr:hypothetical protein [Clostridium perfringens]MDM0660094.1 hypothetical protein [Clostridium perfringens]NGS95879.1 hypothetical protein [Clostridium perfringens]
MLSKKLTKEFLTKRLINKLKVEGFEFGSSQDLNKTVDYILNNYLDTAIMIEEGTIKAIELAIIDYIERDLFINRELEHLYVMLK